MVDAALGPLGAAPMGLLITRMGFPGGLVAPPILAVLTSLVLLGVIHRLARTPELPRTIAVPLSVTAIYSASYAFALWRPRHGRD